MLKRIAALLLALVLMVPMASGLAADENLSPNGSLIQGSSGTSVKKAQQLLKDLGYYTGKIDGKYGTAMVNATKQFQKRNGLTVDGKIGVETWERLESGDAVKKSDKVAVIKGDNKNTTPNGSLILGSSGDGVIEVQTLLNTYGYYTGNIDGKFGKSTENALKLFQSRNGLVADGIAGYKTLTVLRDGANVVKKMDKIPAALTTGKFGDSVENLQMDLANALFYAGEINGLFTPSVERAVREFQAAAGLVVDGKYGPKTMEALADYITAIGTAPRRQLRSGNRGYDVKLLQDRLVEKNFLTAAYTEGYFDAATGAAVAKVEAKNGIAQDGIFGTIVRRYLWPTDVAAEDDQALADENVELVEPTLGATLTLGSRGEQVAYAQMKLKNAGYLLGNADGKFGPETQAAVLKLQKDFNKLAGADYLKEDGIVGQDTWTVIRALGTQAAEHEEVTEEDPYMGAIRRKLYRGRRGNDVLKLQQMLNQLGYPVAEDGKFGPETADAVKEFQKDQKITQDGIVGSITLARMQLCLNNYYAADDSEG